MAKNELRIKPVFEPTKKQLELARNWYDPDCRVAMVGGAIRSGKTQGAGLLLVATAIHQPGNYLVSRLTYRELKDSTQKAMLYGDGALPPLIPPEAIDQYRASDEMVRLRNGSEILFRSLDEPSKLLNLTLSGVLIDQIEELDPGPEGERIFDTLLGRLSDPRGPRKLLAIANPTGTVHWVYRRLVSEETRDPYARYVHVSLRDNAPNLPADYLEAMEATKETRPFWYRAFVLGEWGSFEGAAYTEFTDELHVVEPFPLAEEWERFEAMDHGSASPTAWYVFACDHDGNLIVFDEYYSPGLVSEHAAEILSRRQGRVPKGLNWWQRKDWHGTFQRHYTYADPSIKARIGISDRRGQPASVLTEYRAWGLTGLVGANNDRAAGYSRLRELLHPDPSRPFPTWHPRRGERGAPRIFIFSSCKNLIEQVRSAPIAEDGKDAGKAVDRKWESSHGHAHAAVRYGVMSWHRASPVPNPKDREPEDPRAALLWKHERNVAKERQGRYINV